MVRSLLSGPEYNLNSSTTSRTPFVSGFSLIYRDSKNHVPDKYKSRTSEKIILTQCALSVPASDVRCKTDFMLRTPQMNKIRVGRDQCQGLIYPMMYSSSMSIVLVCYSRHLDLTTPGVRLATL